MLSDAKHSGRTSLSGNDQKRVSKQIRENSHGHFIERTTDGKQRKCAVCKKNARKQCTKCNVGLHIHCYKRWHQ